MAVYADNLTLGTNRWALYSVADPCHLESFVEIEEAAAPADPASSARRLYVDSTSKKLTVQRSSSVSADIEASLTSTANDMALLLADDATDATLTLSGSGDLKIQTGGLGVEVLDNLAVGGISVDNISNLKVTGNNIEAVCHKPE